MNFDDLQVIWDSQQDRPLYALDENAMEALVERLGARIASAVNAFEIGMLAIFAVLALSTAFDPLIKGEDWHQLAGSVLFLGLAAGFLVTRAKRKLDQQGTPATLLENLEQAIARVDYLIWRNSTFFWWFLLPTGLYVVWNHLVGHGSHSPLKFAIVGGSFLLGYAVVRLDLRCNLLPKKAELLSLRGKLLGS